MKALGIILVPTMILALLVAAAAPSAGRIATEVRLDQALEGLFVVAKDKFLPQDLDSIPLNEHAIQRHGEEAQLAYEAVKNCKPENLFFYKGINEYTGYKLLACLLSGGTMAIWILLENECIQSPSCRTISAFLSKGFEYLSSLVRKYRYEPVVPELVH